jgi:hypothetical protein
MPLSGSTALILAAMAFTLGGIAAWYVASRLLRRPRWREDRIYVQTVIERVRAVGKLIGLEVCAKEIATATSGWAWMPPIVLSQARLAMIFNFEKQYWVDLSQVGPEDIRDLGRGRFRLTLPRIQGSMRLIDVTPYDIQAAKVLGLLDLVSMTAERQKELMRRAQQQAASLYAESDAKYLEQARLSLERHLRSLMELFGIALELEWAERPARPSVAAEPEPETAAPKRIPVAAA